MSTTKKPGRPPTGQTPPADRQAKRRAAVAEAGGKQIAMNLSAQAVAALQVIRELDGHPTDRAAVEAALVAHAKRRRRTL